AAALEQQLPAPAAADALDRAGRRTEQLDAVLAGERRELLLRPARRLDRALAVGVRDEDAHHLGEGRVARRLALRQLARDEGAVVVLHRRPDRGMVGVERLDD